jgi:cytochrome c oxidase cbb3-type subunit III
VGICTPPRFPFIFVSSIDGTSFPSGRRRSVHAGMRIRSAMLCLLLLCLGAIATATQDRTSGPAQNPLGRERSAIRAGKLVFENTCSVCHGVTGGGGRGPKLADSAQMREMTDKEIFDVIRNGISGTEMMAFPISEGEDWQLVAFIRSLNALAFQEDVPGDVAAGRAVFFGKGGCSSCHMIAGHGGFLGPDLSNIGGDLSVEKLSESIRRPSSSIMRRYQRVLVITTDGNTIQGLAKNDSTYSIQVLDFSGHFHSFFKNELQKIIYYRQSLMPVGKLSESELQDLLAFLSRQAFEESSEQQVKANHGEGIY